MNDDDRIERFKAEVADLKAKTTSGRAERSAAVLGIVLMLLAVIIGFGSYIQSTNADNALDQNELVILALWCVALAVIGAALFLWTRLVAFWRFWMLRQLYENQEHIDRLLAGRDETR